jgi:glutathione peroxidase
MKKINPFVILVLAFFAFVPGALMQAWARDKAEASTASVLDFKMKNIDGQMVDLKQYKGDVILLVNVASKCGNTPQYEGLQALYEKYKDDGFVVLGFPANNFKNQEPGTDAEIKGFCTLNYGVTFPMFSKISVLGEDKHPLYKFLTEQKTDPQFAGEIKWNFEKFLIDRQGKVAARFDPKVQPQSEGVRLAIERLLKN